MRSKDTPLDAPILDLLTKRWSPVHFDKQPLTAEQIASLFEAARWAPSAFNEQPWLYVYASSDDGEKREALESLLVEGNAWAKKAGLLILSFAKKTFARNGKENAYALHDTGAASLQLVLQATSMGLITHQMSGFDHEKANALLQVPAEYMPGSMIAIGHMGDPATISPEEKKREDAPRLRNPIHKFVFHGQYKK